MMRFHQPRRLAFLLLAVATSARAQSDLAVLISDAPDPLQAGETLTYTIQLRNLGPEAASNVTLTAAVPANTSFMSQSAPAGWSFQGPVAGSNTVTWLRTSLSATDDAGSNPGQFTPLGTDVIFTADGGNGFELWKTNGTAAGTVLVKDIHPAGDGGPAYLTHAGGVLYFVADDGVHGRELWKTDGTPGGTVLVKDIHPGAEPSFTDDLTLFNGLLFFTADDGVNRRQIWKSDGSAAGTVPVTALPPPATGSAAPQDLTPVGDSLYFSVGIGTFVGNFGQLWKTAGGAANTVLLKEFNAFGYAAVTPLHLTALNGTLLFFGNDLAHGYELWRSDGTAGGTVMVKDIYPGLPGSMSNQMVMTELNGALLTWVNDGVHGFELWRSDGSAAGTVLVKDINPGSAWSAGSWEKAFNGTLYFSAFNEFTGREFWKSDGTAAGTVLVQDSKPGPASSVVVMFEELNGSLMYQGNGGTTGQELWTSDGTDAGTILLKEFVPGSGGGLPVGMTNVNGTVYFAAWDSNASKELWKTNGTASGTVRIRNLNAPPEEFTLTVKVNNGTPSGTVITNTATAASASSDPLPANNSATSQSEVILPTADLAVSMTESSDPVVIGRLLVYGLTLTNNGPTAATLVTLADTVPANTTFYSLSVPLGWTPATPAQGGTGIVIATKPVMEPGESAEFTLTVEVNSGIPENTLLTNTAGITSPTLDPQPANNSATLTTLTRASRADLQVTTAATPGPVVPGQNITYDITLTNLGPDDARQVVLNTAVPANTTLVSGPLTVNLPGLGTTDAGSGPTRFTPLNGLLLFGAYDDAAGRELWRSDGTTAGTVRVADIKPGAGSGLSTGEFVERNGFIYFAAEDMVNGEELWRSDGTAGGTALVKNIRPGSSGSSLSGLTKAGSLLFFSANDGTDTELWKSDGTAAGTVKVKDIYPGGDSFPVALTEMGGNFYFIAGDGLHGRELWRSDGSASGTVLVRDIKPGPGNSTEDFPDAAVMDGVIYFLADDGVHGYEPWRSDGTTAGTFMLADIHEGPGHSSAFGFFNHEGTLYFAADDGLTGKELWRSDGTAEGTQLVADIVPGSLGSGPTKFVSLNGILYFHGFDAAHGGELWRTDGTVEGTRLVCDIRQGFSGSFLAGMMVFQGRLYFQANDGLSGMELWRSDGTTAGTQRVTDLNPNGDGWPVFLTAFNDSLLFNASDGVTGPELWRSNGTAAGTSRVRNIRSARSVTSSLIVKVNAGVPSGTVITHSATASNFTPDPVTANNTAVTTVTVVPPNSAPVLSNLEPAPRVYIEGDAPVRVTATIGITDADSPTLAGATVAITGNYTAGEDVLAFQGGVPGVTGAFDSASGVLTLSGNATLSRYRSALQGIAYHNTSYFPVTLLRTVSFQVNDGALVSNLSNVLSRTITVTPRDDTPQVVGIAPLPEDPAIPVLTFSGIGGRTYTVEWNDTLDPAGWQLLGQPVADSAGIFNLKDETAPPDVARRFYRARFP